MGPAVGVKLQHRLAGPIVYSHHHLHHVYTVYWYTKHPGPIIVYSHHHNHQKRGTRLVCFFKPFTAGKKATCSISVKPASR